MPWTLRPGSPDEKMADKKLTTELVPQNEHARASTSLGNRRRDRDPSINSESNEQSRPKSVLGLVRPYRSSDVAGDFVYENGEDRVLSIERKLRSRNSVRQIREKVTHARATRRTFEADQWRVDLPIRASLRTDGGRGGSSLSGATSAEMPLPSSKQDLPGVPRGDMSPVDPIRPPYKHPSAFKRPSSTAATPSATSAKPPPAHTPPLYGPIGGWGPRKGCEYYMELARSAFAVGKPEQAEAALRHAADAALPGSSKWSRARILLGLSLLQQGRAEEAAAECERTRGGTAEGSAEAEACEFNRGLLLSLSGNHQSAVDSFTRAAAATAGSNIDALIGRALALRCLRRYREAARDYINVVGNTGAAGDSSAAAPPWARRASIAGASPSPQHADDVGRGGVKSPSGGGGGGGSGVGGEGDKMLNRWNDEEVLQLLRRPPEARDKDALTSFAAGASDMAFFRELVRECGDEDLEKSLLHDMCRLLRYRRYGRGEVIYARGSRPAEVFVVWGGTVQLRRRLEFPDVQAQPGAPPDDSDDESRPAAEAMEPIVGTRHPVGYGLLDRLVVRGTAPPGADASGRGGAGGVDLDPVQTVNPELSFGAAEVEAGLAKRRMYAVSGDTGCIVFVVAAPDFRACVEKSRRARAERDGEFLSASYRRPKIDIFATNGIWGRIDALVDLALTTMLQVSVATKQVICEQGRPSRGVYFLRKGRLEVRRASRFIILPAAGAGSGNAGGGGGASGGGGDPPAYGLLQDILEAVREVEERTAEHIRFVARTRFIARDDSLVSHGSVQVATLEVGDWFGGESAVQGGQVGNLYTVTALQPSQLLFVPREHLFRLQSRCLQVIREGVAPWVRGLPKGIVSDQRYAQYKEHLLHQVLSTDKSLKLRQQPEQLQLLHPLRLRHPGPILVRAVSTPDSR